MSYYADKENCKSIHISKYNKIDKEFDKSLVDDGEKVMNLVSAIRQFKSENKISLKTFIDDLTITSEKQRFCKIC